MRSAVCPALGLRLARSRAAPIRHYSRTATCFYPTAIHRAEKAADLKKHPESAATQEQLEDRKHNHHWSEKNATISEADVSESRSYVIG